MERIGTDEYGLRPINHGDSEGTEGRGKAVTTENADRKRQERKWWVHPLKVRGQESEPPYNYLETCSQASVSPLLSSSSSTISKSGKDLMMDGNVF